MSWPGPHPSHSRQPGFDPAIGKHLFFFFFFFFPFVQVRPGPALSTRLVSKVETMVVLDRLRFACWRLAFSPAASLAVSLPDCHTRDTCSPGHSPQSCSGLAGWAATERPTEQRDQETAFRSRLTQPTWGDGLMRPEREGDLPKVTQAFDRITGLVRPDRPGS